ncbi:hypothetical protein [Kribbella sp. NPDC055071]
MTQPYLEPMDRRAVRGRENNRRRGQNMLKATYSALRRERKQTDPEIRRRLGRSNLTKSDLRDFAYYTVAKEFRPEAFGRPAQEAEQAVSAGLAQAGGPRGRTRLGRWFANMRDQRRGTKMLKAAYTMAYRDAKKRDGVYLQRVGGSDFDARRLRNLAHGNIQAVINPEWRGVAPAGQPQFGQDQSGPAPQQAGDHLTRMAQMLKELSDATIVLQQQMEQNQQEMARLSAEVDQLRQIIATQNPAAQQQTPAPAQETSAQNTGPEAAQTAPEAAEQPPTPPQQPVAEQGTTEQTPAAVDPAAVDPAAVDPAAVDPAAVDPAAVDPSAAAVDPAAVDPAAVDAEAAAVDPTDLGPDPDAAVGEQLALDLSGEGEVEVAPEAERLATNEVWVDGAAGRTTPAIPEADGEVAQQSGESAAVNAAAPEQGTTTAAPAPAGQAAEQGVGPDDTDTRAQSEGQTPALDPDVAAAAKVGLDSPAAKGSTRQAAAETAANSTPATNGKAGPGPATTKETKTER